MKIVLEIPQFDIIIEQQQELIELFKNKNNGHEKYLTAQEIADVLKISYNQVVAMARKGKIPGKKIGTMWRFSSRVIENWFKNVFASVNYFKKELIVMQLFF